jgi:predicted metal-dependent hydrolase
MNKAERIAAFVDQQGDLPALPLDPRYLGFFKCFNKCQYYEAHDVLEQLWLKTPGADHLFFKGLIQLAGAFVHLKKQHLDPAHHVDGKRLAPAMRLFRLSEKNLAPYRPRHLHCDVAALCALCANLASEIERTGVSRNPWNPENAPQIDIG